MRSWWSGNLSCFMRKPAVIWLTGLSGAGKTTVARKLAELCREKGICPVLLDGDEIRKVTGQGGFDEESRKAHNLRVGQLAALFEQQGHLVIVSMIAPYAGTRQAVREMCRCYVEVFTDTPLEVCIRRDPKGLYRKALSNEIPEFTGISAPYEAPDAPELRIDTSVNDAQECAGMIWEYYSGLKK